MACRYPDALRTDFRRFYRMGFSEAVRGPVPLADLCAMADELLHEPHSAIARTANEGEVPWERFEYLMAHLWQTQTGKPHPGLPKARLKMRDPKRQASINAARDRAAERRRLIDMGEIT